ncbi:MAG: hypothetical protein ACQER6_03945, partial [Pseudomonadota bacterium]
MDTKKISQRARARRALRASIPAMALTVGASMAATTAIPFTAAHARGGNPCAPSARGGNPCAPSSRGGNPCAPSSRGGNPCAPSSRGGNPCAPSSRGGNP